MDLGSPYFVLLTIGFGLAFVWFVRRGERLGLARVVLIDICIAALVGGLVGSRALHVLVEPLPADPLGAAQVEALRTAAAELDPVGRAALEEALARPPVASVWEFVAQMPPGPARERAIEVAREHPDEVPARLWYWARPGEVLQFWRGGLAYFGGLVLAVALCALVTRRHRVSFRELADLAAPGIAIGLLFGRLGCFFGGCCFGEVCDPHWWAAPPPWYEPPVGGVYRFPTALLSALNALALSGALYWLLGRRAFRGEVFLALVALYAPGRFAIEALRADPRGGAGGLSTSQLAVLVTGAPAALAWVWLRLRARGTPHAPTDDPPGDDVLRDDTPGGDVPPGALPVV